MSDYPEFEIERKMQKTCDALTSDLGDDPRGPRQHRRPRSRSPWTTTA